MNQVFVTVMIQSRVSYDMMGIEADSHICLTGQPFDESPVGCVDGPHSSWSVFSQDESIDVIEDMLISAFDPTSAKTVDWMMS